MKIQTYSNSLPFEVASRNLSIRQGSSLIYRKGGSVRGGLTSTITGRLYTYPDAVAAARKVEKLGFQLPTIQQFKAIAEQYEAATAAWKEVKVSNILRYHEYHNLFDTFLGGWADNDKHCYSIKQMGVYWTKNNTQIALYADGSWEELECEQDVYLSVRLIKL